MRGGQLEPHTHTSHTHTKWCVQLSFKCTNNKLCTLFRHKPLLGTMSPRYPQISGIEKRLTEVQKGVLTASDAQRSQKRQAQKAIRTLENKLDRVSYKHADHMGNMWSSFNVLSKMDGCFIEGWDPPVLVVVAALPVPPHHLPPPQMGTFRLKKCFSHKMTSDL